MYIKMCVLQQRKITCFGCSNTIVLDRNDYQAYDQHTLSFLSQERKVASSAAEWRAAIQKVDASVLQQLRENIEGGFDEAAFGERVGFAKLKE